MLKGQNLAYGGELLKTRKGREHGRPLSTKNSMHLVLRSSLAKGPWSFRQPKNEAKVKNTFRRFAKKYGVLIYSLGNAGNHLHLHMKLSNRHTYASFIRAVTGSIAMAVMGVSRTNKAEKRFWDYRPFTRVVIGFRAFLTLKDYVLINQWEGFGIPREKARMLLKQRFSSS